MLDGGAGVHLDAVGGQFGVHQRAQLGVNGGQHLGQLFHLGDRDAADGQGFGHFQADVAGADDDRLAGAAFSRVRMTANVSPIECSRCTPSSGPSAPGPASPLIGGRTGTAPVPTMSLS